MLTIKTDWTYKTFNHLYGSFATTARSPRLPLDPAGVPLDSFGRNVYVDTFDSAYGSGWMRENSFLTHGPNGTFCYGFFPHGSHPIREGNAVPRNDHRPGSDARRDVGGPAPAPYDAATEAAANFDQRKSFADNVCIAANQPVRAG